MGLRGTNRRLLQRVRYLELRLQQRAGADAEYIQKLEAENGELLLRAQQSGGAPGVGGGACLEARVQELEEALDVKEQEKAQLQRELATAQSMWHAHWQQCSEQLERERQTVEQLEHMLDEASATEVKSEEDLAVLEAKLAGAQRALKARDEGLDRVERGGARAVEGCDALDRDSQLPIHESTINLS